MNPDTTAIRADAEAMRLAGGLRLDLDLPTVRALCDGYDDAQRLRARTFADYAAERYQAERDAARQALADLVADLRALCEGGTQAVYPATVDAVIDRHAPEGDR